MADRNTTIKTRAASVPTDLAQARNRLAVAIKNATAASTQDNMDELRNAQTDLERLEDIYREGYLAQLAAVTDRMSRDRNVNR